MKTDLHWLAESGQSGPLADALAAGASLEDRDEDGRTPLHRAVRARRFEIVRLLATGGADLEAAETAMPRSRALHLACAPIDRDGQGDVEMMQLLLGAGADAGSRDACGVTPLQLAVAWCDSGLVQLLLDKGAKADAADESGLTPLHVACRRGAAVLSDALLGDDGDRLMPRPAARADTALGRLEDDAVLEALLDAGAAAGAGDRQGRAPLHIAAAHGQTGAVRLLLAHGARADAADDWGGTPLHRAQDAGVARMLLAAGATRDEPDHEGRTPLHAAIAAGHDEVVDLLLAGGADVTVEDTDGRTPLHLAASAGRALTVEKLIDQGAKVNVRDGDGRTPLFWAEAAGHKLVVTTLRRRGAKRRESREGRDGKEGREGKGS